jgi:hypothetical protein
MFGRCGDCKQLFEAGKHGGKGQRRYAFSVSSGKEINWK